ncbi:unnamed protein product [Mycena citricolor]|uniref:RING-type domain-containing protein n=1 Tax=Mycena citricolor TaxID=2018698 RepID=A0AAD2K480_9AGAR|nr:unnamed protein product [Mycena citricolor]CAK5278109.1 unnamed protein product [Mycena citricolor]
MSTRHPSPSSVLIPTNIRKREISDDEDGPDQKKIKLKSENTPQPKDKKKRKKKKKKTPVVGRGVGALTVSVSASANESASASPTREKRRTATAPPGPLVSPPETALDPEPEAAPDPFIETVASPRILAATLASAKQDLHAQSTALKNHEDTLGQLNQSLTCQICLDLLHKPYALAPCGHVSCYNCLVGWFTSEPDDHHDRFLGPRKKTCPICRATIKERPVEVWIIKNMVSTLVKSGLIPGLSEVPPPPPALPDGPVAANEPPDLWHNIFRHAHQHPMFHPLMPNGEPPSVEDMGMLDMEDGGVYRCLDCMHEIWDGVCTSCHRVYPGHQLPEDDDDDDEGLFDGSDGEDPWPFHMMPIHPGIDYDGPIQLHHLWADGDDEDDFDSDSEADLHAFIDDEDEDEDESDSSSDRPGGPQRAAAIVDISDSESDLGYQVRHPRRFINYIQDSDDDVRLRPWELDASSGDESNPPVQSSRSRFVELNSDDEEDSGEESDGSALQLVISTRGRHNMVVVEDSDDSDSASTIAPTRRRRPVNIESDSEEYTSAEDSRVHIHLEIEGTDDDREDDYYSDESY